MCIGMGPRTTVRPVPWHCTSMATAAGHAALSHTYTHARTHSHTPPLPLPISLPLPLSLPLERADLARRPPPFSVTPQRPGMKGTSSPRRQASQRRERTRGCLCVDGGAGFTHGGTQLCTRMRFGASASASNERARAERTGGVEGQPFQRSASWCALAKEQERGACSTDHSRPCHVDLKNTSVLCDHHRTRPLSCTLLL